MASSLGPLRAPQCTSCLRRIAAGFGEPSFTVATRHQLRGKKTVAKVTTVNVRLLADIERYGKKGTVIPIPSGRMRNDFLPNRKAEYITKEQVRALGIDPTLIERDTTFLLARKRTRNSEEAEVAPGTATEVKLVQMKPGKALDIIERLLPANIDFFRTPIAAPTPAPRRHSPSIPSSSSLSAEAQAAQDAAKGANATPVPRTSIYGSVTTADIASNLKAVLAEDAEGLNVVFGAEDIFFVQEGEEHDRVKHLGIFEFEVRIKGAPDVLRRTIKVNAQE